MLLSACQLWSPHPDLNRGPLPYQGSALPLSYVGGSQPVFQQSLPVVERVVGIEPTSSAWKAEVLPLNYTRLFPCKAAIAPYSGAQKFRQSPVAKPSEFQIANCLPLSAETQDYRIPLVCQARITR